MPTIVDYASLTTAITDFAHRLDISTPTAYTDYFIQGGIDKFQNDIFDLNFGNGLRFQEAPYAPSNIVGGTLPLPTDWLSPKVMYVSDGSSDTFTLIFKSAAWINDTYPQRTPQGLPAYIARDVIASASFTASLNTSGVLAVTALAAGSNYLQVGMVLADSSSGAQLPLSNPGSAVIISGQTNGTTGSTGNYTAESVNPLDPTYTVASEAMTGGGNVFIFGPYPDSDYVVTGTYYQAAPMLSGTQTTNWMVLNAPTILHASCMIKCGEFLENDSMVARWSAIYQPRLQALIDRDKAERWSAATMQVEVA